MVNVDNYGQVDEMVLAAITPHLTLSSLQCKIIQHLDGNTDEIRARLKTMPEPYNKLGELGHRPQIRKWDGLKEFLEYLKGKKIVSSFEIEEGGNIRVYTMKS
jgi:hypothetical protein